MHRLWIALVGVSLLGCQAAGDKKPKLQTARDTLSYSIGLNFGHNLKRDSVDIDPQVFLQGLLDAGKDSAFRMLTDEQAQGAIMSYQREQQTRLEAGAKVAGEKRSARVCGRRQRQPALR
jgi:FKBP-type peptidyl-prolyl cis-trans isomerase FklB